MIERDCPNCLEEKSCGKVKMIKFAIDDPEKQQLRLKGIALTCDKFKINEGTRTKA